MDRQPKPSLARRRWGTKHMVAAALLVAAVGVGSAAATATSSNSGNHSVVLVNEQDGRTLARAGFSLKHELGDTVDNKNAAAAVSAGCDGCRTVAVSVQVVLAESNPQTVVPENLALALNQECSGCASMAAAYQYVLTTGGVVRFTAEGQQQMSSIEHTISDLTESDLPFPELDAELDAQIDRYWDVVEGELVRVGHGHSGRPVKDLDLEVSPDAETCATEPCPSGSATPSPAPAPSPTVSPTASPSDCPSSSPIDSMDDGSPTMSPSPSPSEGSTVSGCQSPSPEPSPSVSESPPTDTSPSPTG